MIHSKETKTIQKGSRSNAESNGKGNTLPAVALQMKEKKSEKIPVQRKENKTGLPDNLKSGVENLSGLDMSDVRVHYNSSKPAQLQALAYAQGTDIHVAPGQEKHLPHEAWHVVQQKQGRVQETRQMKSGVAINDDYGLEREADLMGSKASIINIKSNLKISDSKISQKKTFNGIQAKKRIIQRDKDDDLHDDSLDKNESEKAGLIANSEAGQFEKAQTEIALELVAAYRLLGKLTSSIKSDQKTDGLRNIIIGLLNAGVTAATALTGIPGLLSHSGGTLTANITGQSLGMSATSFGAHYGINSKSKKDLNGKQEDELMKSSYEKLSYVGIIKNKLKEKFGNLKNTMTTLAKLAGIGPFIQLGMGVVTLLDDKDAFKNKKGELIKIAYDIVLIMNDIAGSFESIMKDKKISYVGRLGLLKTTKTFKQIATKYGNTVNLFEKAVREWESKNQLNSKLNTKVDQIEYGDHIEVSKFGKTGFKKL